MSVIYGGDMISSDSRSCFQNWWIKWPNHPLVIFTTSSPKHSGVTDRGVSSHPEKLDAKSAPPISIVLVYSRLFFCVFRGDFAFSASRDIHYIRIHYHFVTFFQSVGSCPPTVASGPLQLRFARPGSNLHQMQNAYG